MTTTELKSELINQVRTRLSEMIHRQKHAMAESQKEANSHKGAMASRYDTFKEEAQALRDGHAQQLQVLVAAAQIVEQLRPVPCENVGMGSLLLTDQGNYFVCTGLVDEAVIVAGTAYECVNIAAPLIRQFRAVPKGSAIKTPGGITTLHDIL